MFDSSLANLAVFDGRKRNLYIQDLHCGRNSSEQAIKILHQSLPKMMKAKALFNRKKSNRPFKEYHAEWVETLNSTLLPLISHSLSSSTDAELLSDHVSLLSEHFQSYYAALDIATVDDVSQVLYPDWRTPLEAPFLFLGDFHPKIFTNLLRSFLESDEDNDSSSEILDFNRRACRNHSEALTGRIDQIECGLRLMVPSMVARSRDAQSGLIDKVAAGWCSAQCRRRRSMAGDGEVSGKKDTEVGKKVTEAANELTCIVLDANRLRRSVIAEILGAIDVHQGALFLQALAQFVVGFRDPALLSEFKRCKIPLR